MERLEWIGHSEDHIFYTKADFSNIAFETRGYKLFSNQPTSSAGFTIHSFLRSKNDRIPIRYDFNISRDLYAINLDDFSKKKLLANEKVIITDHDPKYHKISENITSVRTPSWSFQLDDPWLYGSVTGDYPENVKENEYYFKVRTDGTQFGILSRREDDGRLSRAEWIGAKKYKGYYYFVDNYAVTRVNENMEYVREEDGYPRYIVHHEQVFERRNIPRGGTGAGKILFFHDDWVYFIVGKYGYGQIRGAANYRGGFEELYRVHVDSKKVHQIGSTRKDTFYGTPYKIEGEWLYFLPNRDHRNGCRVHIQNHIVEPLEFPLWKQDGFNAADPQKGYRYIGDTMISINYRGYYIHDAKGKIVDEVIKPEQENLKRLYVWHDDKRMIELFYDESSYTFYLQCFDVKNRKITFTPLDI